MSILVFGQQLSSGLSFKKGAENPEDSGHYPCMRDITRRASLDKDILFFYFYFLLFWHAHLGPCDEQPFHDFYCSRCRAIFLLESDSRPILIPIFCDVDSYYLQSKFALYQYQMYAYL
ncbi:hypothetical protein NPIL_510371 [Nephila pilipes]|uniref:Uncharacterized protein n=1 Tax=Nephila pilipes TaxID=299642 RepID=A0A8X6UF80_NEPPI|nr:hypothetical protein NPIL_510371 [Nephila pilipes]